jgi:hypothetical protein
MIKIAVSQIQLPRLSRWSSICHGGARSNACFRSQLLHRSSSLKTHTYAHSKPLMRANTVDQSAQSRWMPSRPSSAALKSP